MSMFLLLMDRPAASAPRHARPGQRPPDEDEVWRDLRRQARHRFGVTRFRPGQQEIISQVLRGRDTLGILPTGTGKSLCFQLPALMIPGPTVIVSPLIALMKDQQQKATAAGIQVAKLDSTLTTSEEQQLVHEIAKGQQELIYVSRATGKAEYLELLKRAGVSLFVVDEAHCVSQWGHDFRPAYLGLRDAIRALGRPRVLALTATAPPAVAADICQQLDWRVLQVLAEASHEKHGDFGGIRGGLSVGATIKRLAEASGLGERKTRVVVTLLRGAGLLARSGHLRQLRDLSGADELDRLLDKYEKRYSDDHERLVSIMRYAQTTDCRMAFLRAYFGGRKAAAASAVITAGPPPPPTRRPEAWRPRRELEARADLRPCVNPWNGGSPCRLPGPDRRRRSLGPGECASSSFLCTPYLRPRGVLRDDALRPAQETGRGEADGAAQLR